MVKPDNKDTRGSRIFIWKSDDGSQNFSKRASNCLGKELDVDEELPVNQKLVLDNASDYNGKLARQLP